MKLSSTKAAALRDFAPVHPNRQLEIMAGANLITRVQMPAHIDAKSSIGLSVGSASFAEARRIADSMNGLSY